MFPTGTYSIGNTSATAGAVGQQAPSAAAALAGSPSPSSGGGSVHQQQQYATVGVPGGMAAGATASVIADPATLAALQQFLALNPQLASSQTATSSPAPASGNVGGHHHQQQQPQTLQQHQLQAQPHATVVQLTPQQQLQLQQLLVQQQRQQQQPSYAVPIAIQPAAVINPVGLGFSPQQQQQQQQSQLPHQQQQHQPQQEVSSSQPQAAQVGQPSAPLQQQVLQQLMAIVNNDPQQLASTVLQALGTGHFSPSETANIAAATAAVLASSSNASSNASTTSSGSLQQHQQQQQQQHLLQLVPLLAHGVTSIGGGNATIVSNSNSSSNNAPSFLQPPSQQQYQHPPQQRQQTHSQFPFVLQQFPGGGVAQQQQAQQSQTAPASFRGAGTGVAEDSKLPAVGSRSAGNCDDDNPSGRGEAMTSPLLSQGYAQAAVAEAASGGGQRIPIKTAMGPDAYFLAKQRRTYRHEPFPAKLYRMLQETEACGEGHIVSFTPGGGGVLIHDEDAFLKVVLPKYFRHKRLQSFRRQLSMYGFKRLKGGPDQGAYAHELFHRDRPGRLSQIKRVSEMELILPSDQQQQQESQQEGEADDAVHE